MFSLIPIREPVKTISTHSLAKNVYTHAHIIKCVVFIFVGWAPCQLRWAKESVRCSVHEDRDDIHRTKNIAGVYETE